MNKDEKLNQAANDLYYFFLIQQQQAAQEMKSKIDAIFTEVKLSQQGITPEIQDSLERA